MKIFFKKQIRFVAATFGPHQWPVRQSKLLILAYHRILPVSDPRYAYEQPTMVVTPESFEKNIQWVSRFFSFVSLSSWLNACKAGRPLPGKSCAITFDDGWIDNAEFALPILKKYEVPATIYCVSGMLRGPGNYWPGRLITLIRVINRSIDLKTAIYQHEALCWLNKACKHLSIEWGNLGVREYDQIVEAMKCYTDQEVLDFISETKSALSLLYEAPRQILNGNELKELLATGLIDIGSHTAKHTRLTQKTSPSNLRAEIHQSKIELEEELEASVETFCYPNGYHPPIAVEEVKRSSYLAACTLEKGWNNCNSDFSKLRRVSLHEAVASNETHFLSRLSGWI